jgi:hypothetical protein
LCQNYHRRQVIRQQYYILSLYPNFFDYSLGGYYHWERWALTQRYYQESYYLMIKEAIIYLSLYSKYVFDYSLGAYSHREHWSCTRRNFHTHKRVKKAKEDLESAISPIGREYILNQSWITRRFSELKQSNKAATYDSRVVSSRQNSNAMIETYHEGKTPGSVPCGLVYAHECALLVIIRVYDAMKILVDALGTLRTTGTRSL